jgi:AraC-like DNA-binding protein
MQNKILKDTWIYYRAEVRFALTVSVALVLGCWATDALIPGEITHRLLWPIMSACMAVLCLFCAVLCVKHNSGTRRLRVWTMVLLLWGLLGTVLMTCVVLYNIPLVHPSTGILTGSAMITGCLYEWILCIYYPYEVMRPGHLVWWRSVLHLLPLLVLAMLDYLLPVDLLFFIALYQLCLIGILIAQVMKFRQWCEDNFSTMDDVDALWIVRYITMLVIGVVSFFWLCVSYHTSYVLAHTFYFMFILAYTTKCMLRIPDPCERLRSTVSDEHEEDCLHEEDCPPANATLRAALEAWLDEEKPYHNPDFQLTDLRQVLPLNRSYISKFINTEYGCSFYRFVNRRRIADANKMMTEHPEWTMQKISQRCGFSSTRVFYRAFSREMGMTPRKWFNKRKKS